MRVFFPWSPPVRRNSLAEGADIGGRPRDPFESRGLLSHDGAAVPTDIDPSSAASPDLHDEDAIRLSPLERLVVSLVAFFISVFGRVTDLALLLLRPSLLRPYLAVWAAEIRASPYRWPRSFEALRATKQAGQTIRELMYGEVLLASAVFVFWRAGVRRGSRFVDLGAGRGRALLAARWLGAEARGVELLRAHVRAVEGAMVRAGARLEVGDAAEADLSEATHLFLNWCAWRSETKLRMRERIERCRPGTRVVAVTRPIEGSQFFRVSAWPVLFSWGFEAVHVSELGAEGPTGEADSP